MRRLSLIAVLAGTANVERGATLREAARRLDGGRSVQLVQGGTATLDANRVTGDIQLFANRGTQSVTGNRVNGNLQYKDNVPALTGGGNICRATRKTSARPAVAEDRSDPCHRRR